MWFGLFQSHSNILSAWRILVSKPKRESSLMNDHNSTVRGDEREEVSRGGKFYLRENIWVSLTEWGQRKIYIAIILWENLWCHSGQWHVDSTGLFDRFLNEIV